MNIQLVLPNQAAVLATLDQAQPFSAHWTVSDWQAELAQATSHVWCAQEGGQVIGFLALRGAAGQYELVNLAVRADQTRHGIGYRLVSYALEQLAAHGGETITLEVDMRNLAAISLYQKAGFVKKAIRAHFYADGADALVMGRKL